MAKALYPGSFDPITLGHIDIIRRIRPLFSELVVVVANSHRKHYLFSLEERAAMIAESIRDLSDVKIDTCDGLIVEYAQKCQAQVLVRGLRAVSDFEYEFAIANMNKKLKDTLETMIVFTRPEYSFVASNMVKEVAEHGGDLTGLVPKAVAEAIRVRMSELAKNKSR